MDELRAALAEARALGFLGPGPLEAHEASAAAFADALVEIRGRALDLGSGGGVPGLLLAGRFQTATWVLVDRNRRRTSFLARWVADLGWSERVAVWRGGAEEGARDPCLRGTCETVVARSFGPPAVTAECAAGFLRPGGRLAVAEPPDGDQERWSEVGLGELGLRRCRSPVSRIALFRAQSLAPEEVPRKWTAMNRQPRW